MRSRWRLFLLPVLVALVLLPPQIAHAAAPPSDITISYARCFSSVINTGDMVCVTEYEVTYANCDTTTQTGCPTEPSSETLLVSVADGSTLKIVKPYTLENQCCLGYMKGVASVYFTSDEATTFGFDTNPMTAYNMVVANNPLTVSGGLSVEVGIQSNALSKVAMYVQIRNRALSLENSWDQDLLDTVGGVDKLSVDGETYFSNAIPRLREMAHDLFVDVSTTPERDQKDHTNLTADTSARDFLQNAGGNAAFYDDTLNNFGTALGLPGMVFKTLLATLLSVALAAYVFFLTKNAVMGVVVFPLALAALATISIGTMGMVFMIAFACVFMLVWVFILKGA